MGKGIDIEKDENEIIVVAPTYKRIKKVKKARVPRADYEQEPLAKVVKKAKNPSPGLLKQFKEQFSPELLKLTKEKKHLSGSKERFIKKKQFEKFMAEKSEMKRRTMGLDSLGEALPEPVVIKKPVIKAKPKVNRASELSRMKAILANDTFQRDPLNTLKTHLINSMKKSN